MVARVLAALLFVGACGGAHLGDTPGDGSGQGDGPGAIDAPGGGSADAPADALVLGAWGTPQPVTGASDPNQNIDDETLSSDATEMYFGIVDATSGVKQLWMMTRTNAQSPWGSPVKMSATFNVVTSPATTEESPRLSTDDKTLYFGRGGDIYYSTRSAAGVMAWSTPQPLTEVNTANYEKWFAVCNGGYYLVSRNGGANGQDIYEGQLGTPGSTNATELNSAASEISSYLSNDCLTTYFASNRATTTMIYGSTRSTPTGAWAAPAVVTDFGTAPDNEDPWESADQRTFCFATERFTGTNTNKAVYCSTR